MPSSARQSHTRQMLTILAATSFTCRSGKSRRAVALVVFTWIHWMSERPSVLSYLPSIFVGLSCCCFVGLSNRHDDVDLIGLQPSLTNQLIERPSKVHTYKHVPSHYNLSQVSHLPLFNCHLLSSAGAKTLLCHQQQRANWLTCPLHDTSQLFAAPTSPESEFVCEAATCCCILWPNQHGQFFLPIQQLVSKSSPPRQRPPGGARQGWCQPVWWSRQMSMEMITLARGLQMSQTISLCVRSRSCTCLLSSCNDDCGLFRHKQKSVLPTFEQNRTQIE